MELGSLDFATWWYLTLAVLGVAAAIALRSKATVRFEQVGFAFLAGLAAGLIAYLIPSGPSSVGSLRELQLRFFCALGVSWLIAMRVPHADAGVPGYWTLALAGFAGVSAPLLTLLVSSLMVCGGGQPTCAI
jgi:hypothetical protein